MGILNLIDRYGKENLLVSIRVDSINNDREVEKVEYFKIIEDRYTLKQDYKIEFECISNSDVCKDTYYISDFDSLCRTVEGYGVFVKLSSPSIKSSK